MQTQTRQKALAEHARGLTRGRVLMAFFPYLLVIAVFSLAELWTPLEDFSVGRAARSRGRVWTRTCRMPRAQQTAAVAAGPDPTLLVAANTSGGVVGNTISPQNLTIAATAVGIVGREADLFRGTIFWSIGLLLLLCVLIHLQSDVLAGMLP